MVVSRGHTLACRARARNLFVLALHFMVSLRDPSFFFSFPVMIQQYTILYHIPNHRVEFYWISALSEPALFFFAARATFEVLTDERAFSPASKISVDLFSRLL